MVEITLHPVYSCKNCRNIVALRDDIISKDFVAKSGKGYMFSRGMNMAIGAKEDKQLISGYFSIAPIFCTQCDEEMGWTYIKAFDAPQKYKEGKYVFEMVKLLKEF
ncbi:hypothetical protein ACJIZ3_003530 [Penstemon smallii]|uniref:Protein yippee-like n=1 Tax=Penstemon smallii TaxID=265156 RepID=A0ABD3UCX2_9LAMI